MIKDLAKRGKLAELTALWDRGERFDLETVFEQAVQDFRTVKRNPGHLDILKFCIDQGLEPSPKLAHKAALHGNRAIIDYMIDVGLPDDPYVAAALGDVSSLKRFENLASTHNDDGFNLLHCCASSGLGRSDEAVAEQLASVCKFLIDQGVSTSLVVQKDLPITPAFCCASTGGNAGIMEQLLDAGEIDVHGLHREIEFTLEPHQRSGEPFYQVAQVILDRGFDLNSIRPSQGRTLLHGSANRGTKVAVAWLLEKGADPNALDVKGRTPLHVAAERNSHASGIEMLIRAGADPTTKDASGQTALEIARQNGREKVVAYLQ